jgi:hypothetical protein
VLAQQVRSPKFKSTTKKQVVKLQHDFMCGSMYNKICCIYMYPCIFFVHLEEMAHSEMSVITAVE